MEERRNVSDKLGISGELQLSDHPNLGKWYIKVESEVLYLLIYSSTSACISERKGYTICKEIQFKISALCKIGYNLFDIV